MDKVYTCQRPKSVFSHSTGAKLVRKIYIK